MKKRYCCWIYQDIEEISRYFFYQIYANNFKKILEEIKLS